MAFLVLCLPLSLRAQESGVAQVSRGHSESAMRWLRTLMLVVITLLSVFLFATNIGKVVGLQGGYQRQLEGLSEQ